MVHDDQGLRLAVEHAQQPPDLLRADHLGGDQEIAHAGGGHHLGLADLGHADADGAGRHLAQRDLRALVRLGVGAELLAGGLHVGGHLPDIALEAIEVEQQRGGRQLGARHGSVRIPLGLGTGSSCEAEQIGRGRRASGTP